MESPADYHRQQLAIARVVRGCRLEAGVTQEELARRLGRPRTFVTKYEAGERRLSFVDVWAICRALGIGLDRVLEGFEMEVGAPA